MILRTPQQRSGSSIDLLAGRGAPGVTPAMLYAQMAREQGGDTYTGGGASAGYGNPSGGTIDRVQAASAGYGAPSGGGRPPPSEMVQVYDDPTADMSRSEAEAQAKYFIDPVYESFAPYLSSTYEGQKAQAAVRYLLGLGAPPQEVQNTVEDHYNNLRGEDNWGFAHSAVTGPLERYMESLTSPYAERTGGNIPEYAFRQLQGYQGGAADPWSEADQRLLPPPRVKSRGIEYRNGKPVVATF